MIITSFKSGLSLMWQNKRLVWIYFSVNFGLTLLIALPLRTTLSDFAGHSLMTAETARRLDLDFLFEFFKYNKNFHYGFLILVVLIFSGYWMFNLFLSGGVMAVFAKRQPYSPALFWGQAARFFGRFFRLLLLGIPLFALLFSLQFLVTAVERTLFGRDPYEYITYWGDWLRFALRGLILLLFGMILDYARIHLVFSDGQYASVALWQAMKLVFRKIVRTLGLKLALVAGGLLALGVYLLIASWLSAPYAVVAGLLFLWQQTYLFFRMMLRLTLYASEIQLYVKLTAESQPTIVTFTGEMDSEGLLPDYS
ncbi:MAG: hypothetical protein ACE5HS_16415 [bacterium]